MRFDTPAANALTCTRLQDHQTNQQTGYFFDRLHGKNGLKVKETI
jgi:hypothetical protein